MHRYARRTFVVLTTLLATLLLVVVPHAASTEILDTRFGLNSFITSRFDWQDWERPAAATQELGVSWLREEFTWKYLEPERGNWNWEFTDRSIRYADNTGAHIMGLIDYSAPWATAVPDDPQADKYMPDLDLWRTYVRAVVGRYRDQVDAWQVWNEPNISIFFKPEPDPVAYHQLLSIASEEIRRLDPSAPIVLAGTSRVDIGFTDALMAIPGTRDLFDIFAFHPYPVSFAASPEQMAYVTDMENAQRLGDTYNKPVWLTEIGWPNHAGGPVSEQMQAAYLVRTTLLSYPYDRIQKYFWYDLRDDGDNAQYHEHRFGLMDRNFAPKSAYVAYRYLISQLSRAEYQNAASIGRDGLYDIRFTKGTETVRTVWSTTGIHTYSLQTAGGAIRILDILGNDLPIRSDAGRVYVELGPDPVYIITADILAARSALQLERIDYAYVTQSSHVVVSQGETPQLFLTIRNTGTTIWTRERGPFQLQLGTCRAQDRSSIFFDSETWAGANRPGVMREEQVAPGETATFVFTAQTGGVAPGTYQEYVCPLVSGVTWLSDRGIYWDIEVK